MCLRFAADQAHAIRPQHRRGVERHIIAEAVPDGDVIDRQAEFLGQFASQRLGFGLTGRDLAAGQLPAPGQLGRPDTLRHQEPEAADHGRRDDDLGRHGQ